MTADVSCMLLTEYFICSYCTSKIEAKLSCYSILCQEKKNCGPRGVNDPKETILAPEWSNITCRTARENNTGLLQPISIATFELTLCYFLIRDV